MSNKARLRICGAFVLVGAIVCFSNNDPRIIVPVGVVSLFFCGMGIWYWIRLVDEKPIEQLSVKSPNPFGSKQRMQSALGFILGAYAAAILVPLILPLIGISIDFELYLMIDLVIVTLASGFVWLRLRKI